MTYTPGPWIIRNFPFSGNRARDYVVTSTPDVDGRFVGSLIAVMTTDPNTKANLALISAAPDLLNCLEKAVADRQATDGMAEWFDEAKAAIRKAKGQPE